MVLLTLIINIDEPHSRGLSNVYYAHALPFPVDSMRDAVLTVSPNRQ